MKILLSPSKTMKIAGCAKSKPFHLELTNLIADYMAKLDIKSISKYLKIKDEKSQEVKVEFEDFSKTKSGAAILSFTGLAFKNLDWESLDEDSKAYGDDHLLIMSGLYGALKPMDEMKRYRLDLENRVFNDCSEEIWEIFTPYIEAQSKKKSLNVLWQKAINELLAKEELIINLASKEYYAIIEHPNMYTVIFEELKNDKWKQASTMSKQMRGKMARYLLLNKVEKIEELPSEIEGFEKVVLEDRLISYRK